MNERRKLNEAALQGSFLVIGAGIVIALLVLNYALPRRQEPEYQPQRTSLPLPGVSDQSGGDQATPTPSLEFQVVAQTQALQNKNCTYTDEYWRTHPQAWATESIIIGQFSFTKQEGLTVLNTVTEDTSTLVQKQFLSAALNILKGADPNAIDTSLNEASQWIDTHPPKVGLLTFERRRGIELAQILADYNQGVLGPGPCPDQPATSTPTPSHTPTATLTPTSRIFLPIPTLKASRTPDLDERVFPTEPAQSTTEPAGTSVPTQVSGVTQVAPATQGPRSTPTSAPIVPPTPVDTLPPSPEPTSPPPDTPPPPSEVPPPTPVPPPTEAPSEAVTEEPSATDPPNITDLLPTLGLPIP